MGKLPEKYLARLHINPVLPGIPNFQLGLARPPAENITCFINTTTISLVLFGVKYSSNIPSHIIREASSCVALHHLSCDCCELAVQGLRNRRRNRLRNRVKSVACLSFLVWGKYGKCLIFRLIFA
jgi:hypothetical protein